MLGGVKSQLSGYRVPWGGGVHEWDIPPWVVAVGVFYTTEKRHRRTEVPSLSRSSCPEPSAPLPLSRRHETVRFTSGVGCHQGPVSGRLLRQGDRIDPEDQSRCTVSVVEGDVQWTRGSGLWSKHTRRGGRSCDSPRAQVLFRTDVVGTANVYFCLISFSDTRD